MADIVKLSSHERTKPALGGFVQTEAALDIQRTLNKVQASGGGQMGLIVGQPGCGKTQPPTHLKAHHRHLLHPHPASVIQKPKPNLSPPPSQFPKMWLMQLTNPL